MESHPPQVPFSHTLSGKKKVCFFTVKLLLFFSWNLVGRASLEKNVRDKVDRSSAESFPNFPFFFFCSRGNNFSSFLPCN